MNFALLLLALCLPSTTQANWLYLAVSGVGESGDVSDWVGGRGAGSGLAGRPLEAAEGAEGPCAGLDLSPEQRDLCLAQPYAMRPVASGARDALVECQWQFKYERWNCTPRATEDVSGRSLFGDTLRSGNREAAFISAITSAGVVYAVTKACSSGNLTECNCNSQPYTISDRYLVAPAQPSALKAPLGRGVGSGGGGGGSPEKWTWGGCSDDVGYGVRFSRRFLDRAEKQRHRTAPDVRHLVNLHNNEVGRLAIQESLRRQCRCHGVSGSCDFQTCWLQMGKFTDVGAKVKARYDRLAVQVAKRAKKRLRRKERAERRIPIRPEEMVFVAKSPNYCDADAALGIPGTRGRHCNASRSLLEADSCDSLCCGRGYETKDVLVTKKCQCKFVWCCHVKCKTCTSLVKQTTCH